MKVLVKLMTLFKTRILPKHPVMRFMVVHWLLGMTIGAAVAAAILVLDIGGIRSLMQHSDVLITANILLFAGFSLSFGGAFCATAVMGLSDKPHGKIPEQGQLCPIPVKRRQRMPYSADAESLGPAD